MAQEQERKNSSNSRSGSRRRQAASRAAEVDFDLDSVAEAAVAQLDINGSASADASKAASKSTRSTKTNGSAKSSRSGRTDSRSRSGAGRSGSTRSGSRSGRAGAATSPQQDAVLIAPPKYRKGSMRITPLGGLGEIGRNMNVVEYNGHLLLIDCGVLFPEEEQPGVDLILPDFSYIKDRMDQVEALVLTHGHEDHIGGVPYLLKLRPDIPLIGSKLTLAFVEAKCKEHRINPTKVEVTGRDKLKVGPFEL